METTGERGKIHVSQEFADQLKSAGKSDWLTPRTDAVSIKGKGVFQTYWLVKEDSEDHVVTHSTEPPSESVKIVNPNKEQEKTRARLVAWNVEVLMSYLKQIVAHRQATGKQSRSYSVDMYLANGTPLDEAKDMIALPVFAPSPRIRGLSVLR